jgi:hypothetical protein
MLGSAVQPALELVLPPGFRRTRAVRARLLASPGRSGVRIHARGERLRQESAALAKLTVAADPALLADLRELLGEENVHLTGEESSGESHVAGVGGG